MSRWTDRRRGLLLVALAALGLAAALPAVGSRWRVGIATADQLCLPYRAFLIDLADRRVRRGHYVAFVADDRLARFFPAGSQLIKEVAGVPGDRVVVTAAGIEVNGVPRPGVGVAYGSVPLSVLAGLDPLTLYRDEPVPPGRLWVMGTTVNSFDSRYWGWLNDSQVLGRAYPLW